MKRQESLYVAMCLGAIAFGFMFVAPQLAELPVAWYWPLEHRWSFEAQPAGFAMDFYGRLGAALVAWSVVVIATLAITKRITRPLSDRVAGLLAAWTLTLTLLVILYFAWTLMFRVPAPLPLPHGYLPR